MNGVLVDVLTRLQQATRAYRESSTVDALDASYAVDEINNELGELLCPLDDRPDLDLSALALPVPTRATANTAELEAHWKAGFLRGAKFWYGRTEEGTMWQSEQNECWQASHELWPPAPGALRDARLIVAARLRALAEALEVQG